MKSQIKSNGLSNEDFKILGILFHKANFQQLMQLQDLIEEDIRNRKINEM